MNVKDWGPSGWILLHKTADQYHNDNRNNVHIRKLYCTLREVLPCKYCRMSYKDFLSETPIDSWLNDSNDLSFFVYMIHNKVNLKLRRQAHTDDRDPLFSTVRYKYAEIDGIYTLHNSWKFLYAIAFNYPTCEPEDPTDPVKKLAYRDFFEALVHTFPDRAIAAQMRAYYLKHPIRLTSRKRLIVWLYGMQLHIHSNLGMIRPPGFDAMYAEMENMRAKCAQNTCRTPFY